MEQKDMNRITEYLVSSLLKNGFVIQRYDSYSTNSIYLKLDYGVCNSIRISDHPGKKHLKYRYNIGPHIKKFSKEKDKYDRYYYRSDKCKNLVKKILCDRQVKIDRYGKEKYESYMRENARDKSNNAGFWRDARLITLEEF